MEAINPRQLMCDVMDGKRDPLKSYIELKKLEYHLKEAIEVVKEYALTEATKYGKSSVHDGCKCDIRNAPGQWKFDDVPGWLPAKERLKELEEKAKAAFKSKMTLVDEATGETVSGATYTEGKTILAVTLPKFNNNQK
mgnify:CR=1 FL=1